MFDRDHEAIAQFVRVGANGWENRAASVSLAVAFTIRTQTFIVSNALSRFSADGQYGLWCNRRSVHQYIRAGRHIDTFRRARAAIEVDDSAGALLALCDIPGIGLVKAGFITQMIWGVVGCIDSRNASQFGIQPPELRARMPQEKRLHLAHIYVAMCNKLGGAEYLWDNWCRGVATEQKAYFSDADHVSAEHVHWCRLAHKGLWG